MTDTPTHHYHYAAVGGGNAGKPCHRPVTDNVMQFETPAERRMYCPAWLPSEPCTCEDDNWEGHPKASEHRTLGERAWCFDCKTYCYRYGNCDCCLEAKGWVRLWLRPDGVIVDEDGDRMFPND